MLENDQAEDLQHYRGANLEISAESRIAITTITISKAIEEGKFEIVLTL